MSSPNSRKAKVTDETRADAQRLRELWQKSSRYSQAEFGELYNIGNQSAVGQYLRGELPLSLKAAAGFAYGLGCTIADISPKLADLAWDYAEISGLKKSEPLDLTLLSREEIQHVLMLRKLSEEHKLAITSAMIFAVASRDQPVSVEQILDRAKNPKKPAKTRSTP